MDEIGLYEEIIRLRHSGKTAALATVVATQGSSPRKAGAKMLVRPDGSILGTVGGGRVEAETREAAQEVVREGAPRSLDFVLTEENGFACGGRLTIFIEPLGAGPHLLCFGAGHVGRALAPLAASCGFRVTVVDDRPDYARAEIVPGADDVLCARPAEAIERLTPGGESYIVIATTGHLLDFEAVRAALKTPVPFIGLVGSVRKKEALQKSLASEGFRADDIQRVITPVGLDIGAETPAEIAVSIVGQIVRERRGEKGGKSVGKACAGG